MVWREFVGAPERERERNRQRWRTRTEGALAECRSLARPAPDDKGKSKSCLDPVRVQKVGQDGREKVGAIARARVKFFTAPHWRFGTSLRRAAGHLVDARPARISPISSPGSPGLTKRTGAPQTAGWQLGSGRNLDPNGATWRAHQAKVRGPGNRLALRWASKEEIGLWNVGGHFQKPDFLLAQWAHPESGEAPRVSVASPWSSVAAPDDGRQRALARTGAKLAR